ncbi:MAG: response regulator [Deltaproteobacteria bacterium]|nr:response regulator [Deltaproteobacteria bacterium]
MRPLETVRVLVVEGDRASNRLVSIVLELGGAMVVSAKSGDEAENHLCMTRFDVVVLDLVLPCASGLDLASAITSSSATSHVVCIALTTTADRDLEHAARRAGCAAIVRKPIDTETFAETVAAHLRGKR